MRRMITPSKQKVFVGNYSIGNRTVDLVAVLDTVNGSFVMTSHEHKIALIEVGLLSKSWREVFDVLLHETTELAMTDAGLRYVPAPDYAYENGSYSFHMTHTQFSDIAAKVSEFLTPALPELFKVFDNNKRKQAQK